MKIFKRVLGAIAALLGIFVLVVGGYIGYMELSYSRIPDMQPTEVIADTSNILQPGVAYTAVTYNIGFGAYTPDYTFFMDEGVMADGTKTVGKSSRAASRKSVERATQGSINILRSLKPDFLLLQEVDTDSDRSYHVNQLEAIVGAFPDHGYTFASNFHSAYLAYPFTEPHGVVNAGMLTMANAHIESAMRRSYPIDEAFPTKYFDLDRCFEVLRLPVEGGHELVLINSHMSAYDEGGKIRAQQFKLLNSVLEQEALAGNYVICGGDWNHALAGSLELYPSKQGVPPWVSVFDEKALAEGYHVVVPDNLAEVPSVRGDDIPYEKGVTYTTTVDGFIVSSNVEASTQNIDTGFETSDHNPVKLTFTLKK